MFDPKDRPVMSACFLACVCLLCLSIGWDEAALAACGLALVLPLGELMGQALEPLCSEIDHE